MANIDAVDLFHGNGAVDTPVPRGMAAAWNWLKAQVGNTHPGACSPFGMVSACAYSGAYPSGYGLYGSSCCFAAPRMFERLTATGFTHFHHSGTGFVGRFYNYFRTIPSCRPLATPPAERWDLISEHAAPGGYRTELNGTGIRAELTVHGKVARHRYTFTTGAERRILVDCTGIGLLPKECRELADRVVIHRTDTGAVVELVVEGFPIYAAVAGPGRVYCWRDQEVLDDCRQLEFTGTDTAIPAGIGFDLADAGRQAEIHFGFSFRSGDQARQNLERQAGCSFAQLAASAHRAWANLLDRIEIETPDADVRQIFYSSLYHSLIKPIRADNESPYWAGNTAFFCDFTTMWDLYKTVLPLTFTIAPEVGSAMVDSMLRSMSAHGEFPTAYLLLKDFDKCSEQAANLAHHSLFDAWCRGLDADWVGALKVMHEVFAARRGGEFAKTGLVKPVTHTLDLAGAAFAMATMAKALGQPKLAGQMGDLAKHWRNAYDPATGLLTTDSRFYEGTHWNYSFRPLPEMAERIALYPAVENFVADLDRFFGYLDVADGKIDPEPDPETWTREIREDLFEGVNNESDMETPYAYVYAGRHDRTAEVVRAAMKYQYAPGIGGLPGNDDSGGLSSWYVWNAMGLFPVSGQDLLLIGSPLLDRARIRTGDREFVIRVDGNSDAAIHVQHAWLNGQPLAQLCLSPRDIQQGGELRLEMGPDPQPWPAPVFPRR